MVYLDAGPEALSCWYILSHIQCPLKGALGFGLAAVNPLKRQAPSLVSIDLADKANH